MICSILSGRVYLLHYLECKFALCWEIRIKLSVVVRMPSYNACSTIICSLQNLPGWVAGLILNECVCMLSGNLEFGFVEENVSPNTDTSNVHVFNATAGQTVIIPQGKD